MHCEKVRKKLLDYLEKELKPSLRGDMDEHLSHCVDCRQELKSLEEDLEFLTISEKPHHPDAFWEDFTVNLAERLSKEELKLVPAYKRVLLPLFRFGVAAALILLLFRFSFYKMTEEQFLQKRNLQK